MNKRQLRGIIKGISEVVLYLLDTEVKTRRYREKIQHKLNVLYALETKLQGGKK